MATLRKTKMDNMHKNVVADDVFTDDSFLSLESDVSDDNDMPTTKTKRGGRHKTSGNKQGTRDSKIQYALNRQSLKGQLNEEKTDPNEDKKKHEEKLLSELSDVLREYSQQRMRALHMSFRLYSNDDMRITYKEMIQSLQENNMSMPSLLLKTLAAKFDSSKGINIEPMFKFLTEAHHKTGRDSVLALHTRNDLAPRKELSQEEIDDDLLWRIESQLVRTNDYIDIKELRKELQKKDTQQSGKLDFATVKNLCDGLHLPVFGALLKNLLKRCASGNTQRVRWPEFLSFLEKGQENAWETCPQLKSLPEQNKKLVVAAPDLLDELSDKAKANIVTQLRKKSISVRVEHLSGLQKNQAKPNEETKTTDKETGNELKVNDEQNGKQKEDTKSKDETGGDKMLSNKSESDKNSKKEAIEVRTSTPRKRSESSATKTGRTSETAAPENTNKSPVMIDIKIDEPSDSSNSPTKSSPDSDLVNEDVINIVSRSNDVAPNDDIGSIPSEEGGTSLGDSESKDSGTAEEETKDDNTVENKNEEPIKGMDNRDGSSNETETAKMHESREQPESTGESEVKGTPIQISLKINDRTVTYDTYKEFLEEQTIDPPTERMKLQWVYGYRGNDCRKNIHILANDEVVYFVSYIAVIYNQNTHKQRHYREHTDDIKCIDIHHEKTIVATGQFASKTDANIKAHIRVWRSDNLTTLHVLGEGLFETSVACVAFSPCQNILAAVDNSLEKKLTIWDTEIGDLRGQELLHTNLVCDVGFNPKYNDTLVTVGKEHTCWWKIYPASCTLQNMATPDFGTFLKAKYTICLTFNDKGDLITGDSNGTIYVFGDGGNKITNFIKHAHDGPVFSLLHHKGFLLSGGRDGIIHCWQWNKNMDTTGFIQIHGEGGVRMLRMSTQGLLIGTTMNSLLLLRGSDTYTPLEGATLDDSPVTQCQYEDVRGITTIYHGNTGDVTDVVTNIVTVGQDGIICGYNTTTCSCTMKIQNKGFLYTCVDASLDGSLLLMGTKDGRIHILSKTDDSWKEIWDRKLSKDVIDCIKLSPDKQNIAAGCQDSAIYMITYVQKEDTTFSWEFQGKLKGHSGYITGLDWTREIFRDGLHLLRSSSSVLQLKYWLGTDEYSSPISSQHVNWATNTVHTDIAAIGMIASKINDETEVTSLITNGRLGVTGDSTGTISLFKYPCSQNGTYCHTYRSHATVLGTTFSPAGKHVLTVGGRDSCMMQWELV